jgi:hypothetical protein
MQYIILKRNGDQVKSVGMITIKGKKQSSAISQYKKVYKEQTGRRLTGEFLVLPLAHGGWYELKKGKLIKYERFYS